jgi:hypothetical protein
MTNYTFSFALTLNTALASFYIIVGNFPFLVTLAGMLMASKARR